MELLEQGEVVTVRLGDTINFPKRGEQVGVHYTLRNQEDQVIESTYRWGKPFEWRVGQSSMLPQIDSAICQVSLGGKIRVTLLPAVSGGGKEIEALTYELELLYIQ